MVAEPRKAYGFLASLLVLAGVFSVLTANADWKDGKPDESESQKPLPAVAKDVAGKTVLLDTKGNPEKTESTVNTHAWNKLIKFNFDNVSITSIINAFAKESGINFVVDPSVRGNVSIFAASPVSIDEAYALLSSALATNGFAISVQDGNRIVLPARRATRSELPVLNTVPAMKPERLVSVIYSLKNVNSEEVSKSLRSLPSRDGEMQPAPGNKIIVTDWVSNQHRIAKTIDELDRAPLKTK